MPDIVGVRFKKAGKVYYFDPTGTELKILDSVVVQTARGMELGLVAIAPKQVLASEITGELKPIVRKANEEDIKRAQVFTEKEPAALSECSKMVTKLNLPMKLVSAEYNLDGTRLTFYFTAEERVDFRELVRELTAFFKTRIELRQIGPRDQAKLVGGLGRCGRALCCSGFLSEFNPVSIKMAKEQDLPLDPMKISGVCGRLQCCLAYENAQYHEAKALLPKRGQPVNTPAGPGIVIGGNPLKETVLVEMESKAEAEFPLNQITIMQAPAKAPPEEIEIEAQEAIKAKPTPVDHIGIVDKTELEKLPKTENKLEPEANRKETATLTPPAPNEVPPDKPEMQSETAPAQNKPVADESIQNKITPGSNENPGESETTETPDHQ